MSNSTQQLKAEQRRELFSALLREMFQLNPPADPRPMISALLF
jgi:hypothetical protein